MKEQNRKYLIPAAMVVAAAFPIQVGAQSQTEYDLVEDPKQDLPPLIVLVPPPPPLFKNAHPVWYRLGAPARWGWNFMVVTGEKTQPIHPFLNLVSAGANCWIGINTIGGRQ